MNECRRAMQEIADTLTAVGMPTLSDRGTWKPGPIANLLAKDYV